VWGTVAEGKVTGNEVCGSLILIGMVLWVVYIGLLLSSGSGGSDDSFMGGAGSADPF
jgi:hypothetical protein